MFQLRPLHPLTIALSTLALAGTIQAETLISDNFDNLGSGTNLNSRTPTINLLNNNKWAASTATFFGTAGGGINVSNVDARTATIDLGAGFFTSNPGVYQLSLDISLPTGTNAQSWLALGFSIGSDVNGNFVNNNAAPWALYRLNSNVNFYGGPNTTNQLTNNGGTTLSSSAAVGASHTFTLTLNTALPSWTLEGAIDGMAIDLNGTGAAGTTYTYTSNPTTIRYIGISAGNNGSSATGTVDNFTFTGPVLVPEPGSIAALLGGSALLLSHVRRRRQA